MSRGDGLEGKEEEPRKRGNQESIVLEHGLRNRKFSVLVHSGLCAPIRAELILVTSVFNRNELPSSGIDEFSSSKRLWLSILFYNTGMHNFALSI
jgi:hypothetical protein